MRDNDLVVMGFVRGAFGVRGALKIQADTEYSDSLLDYPVWWLGKDGNWQQYKLLNGQVQVKGLVAQLAGVADRDEAEALRGYSIAIPRSEFPEAPDGEFYWHDLIGLKVQNLQGVDFGTVAELMETGANDVLVVEHTDRQRLIPFVDAVIANVDLEQGILLVEWDADF